MLGRHDITKPEEEGGEERNISSTLIHPDYRSNREHFKSDADIAILTMDSAVSFTEFIQPIGLPSMSINVFNAKGYVVGHGVFNIATSETSATPKQVEMFSVNNTECYSSNPESTIVVSKRSFCAKGNFSAPCNGRSSTYLFTN